MAADPTLQIIVKLNDIFTKPMKGLVGVTRTTFSKIGSVVGAALRPFRSFAKSIFSIKGLIAGLVAGGAIKGIISLATRTEDLGRAFENLQKSIGELPSKTLRELQRATKNTVTDIELMQAANNAVLLGVAQTSEQFFQMANAGRILGKAVGRDALEGFNDLVSGIGRSSKPILDNLGLIMNVGEANEAYAQSLGKSVEELTDLERKEAFRSSALALMQTKLKALGPDVASLSEIFGRFTAILGNIAAEMAREFAPALAKVADNLTEFLKSARNDLRAFAVWIGGIAGIVVDSVVMIFKRLAAKETTFLAILSKLFRVLWIFVQTFMTGFFDWLWEYIGLRISLGYAKVRSAIHSFATDLLQDMRTIPGLQEFIDTFAEGYKLTPHDMIPGVDDIRVTYARECARLADEMTQILGSAIDELTPALKELGETALGKEGMTKIILDLEAISKRAASVYSSVADEVIEANGKLKKDTEDTIGRTCAVWETLKLGAQQYFESFKGLMQTWADAVSETLLNVENALSDFFFDALMGKLKSFKDYLRSFLTDMARSISRAFSASIMQTIVKLGVPSLVGAIGGLFGGAAPAGGGGALPTMDMPAPFMQKGGIVSRPQLSWIGEGGRSEAVVPLPDNRSIPVTLKGGTQAPPVNVNFYVNAIDSTTFGAWLQKHRTQVQGMILQAVGTDPNFRASFRSI